MCSSHANIDGFPLHALSKLCRVRGVAAALSAIVGYFFRFASIKTYYDLETSLSIQGFTLLSCIIGAIGIVLMYNIMPETEGRSLEEIEMHFSDNSKKITDRNIVKFNSIRRE